MTKGIYPKLGFVLPVAVTKLCAEDNEDLVQFLVDADILPGNTVTIEEVATYRGVITIASNKTTTSIGFEPASQVWVTDVTIAG